MANRNLPHFPSLNRTITLWKLKLALTRSLLFMAAFSFPVSFRYAFCPTKLHPAIGLMFPLLHEHPFWGDTASSSPAFLALNSWEPGAGPGSCSAFPSLAFSDPSIWNFLFKWLNFPLAHLPSLRNISTKESAHSLSLRSCLPPSFLSLKYRALVFNFWVSQWCPSSPFHFLH